MFVKAYSLPTSDHYKKKKMKKKIKEEKSANMIGLVKLHVVRGMNLVIKDNFRKSSDPYVFIRMGEQKLKTDAMKRSVNPEWNQELTLVVEDPTPPIKFEVYDKDRFSRDDPMGIAELDIEPLVESAKMNLEGLPSGTIIKKLPPCRQNCLADVSSIWLSDGKITQHAVLRLSLGNVECGEIELQLKWIKIPEISGSGSSI